ncbi:MAG TPA: 5-formyltetrahydrofolate cyclo-ligase [Clostridiales bacterium]|nr:5-formyltetrahydrofolate cyclo-ligase [Clostridiales bacterium]
MNDETVRRKKALRREIKALKKDISPQERQARSENIMKKIEAHPAFASARTVFIFWPMEDEVDTRDLIMTWADRKRFILPAINGAELFLKEFTGVQKLVSGDIYAIPEPEGKPFTDFGDIGLAIIPGVAFDSDLNRLGRGKAYYDKILDRLKGKAELIGICYDFQLVDKVPTEPHDVKLDGVICG